jgi:hemerythrin-like domain-containing protein
MKLEEVELFPLARIQLRDEDWIAIDAVTVAAQDPLFGAKVDERYRALRRQIAAAARCGCVIT